MKYRGSNKYKIRDFCIFNVLKEGFFVTFFFFTQLYSLSNSQIYKLVNSTFDKDLLGLSEIISEKRKDHGKWFELESALYFNRRNNDFVRGLNLAIEIGYLENPSVPVKILLGDSNIFLTATEFDVITNFYCVEAKSGKFNSKKNKKQLIKEKNMIDFIKFLKKSINLGTVTLEIENNKYGSFYLKINGDLTLYKDIRLKCNWINCKAADIFLLKWLDIIDLLSDLSVCLAIKTELNNDIKEWLFEKNITYVDNLRYEN